MSTATATAPVASVIETTKLKAAIEAGKKAVAAIQAELGAVSSATYAAAQKGQGHLFSSLADLATANKLLDGATQRIDKSTERIAKAVDKATPKVKEEKPAKEAAAKK